MSNRTAYNQLQTDPAIEASVRAWGLRVSGMTAPMIAAEMGCHVDSVYVYLKKAREDARERGANLAEHEALLMLAQIDERLADWMPRAKDNERAMDKVIKLWERKAKLLGLDAPERQQVEVSAAPLIRTIEPVRPLLPHQSQDTGQGMLPTPSPQEVVIEGVATSLPVGQRDDE